MDPQLLVSLLTTAILAAMAVGSWRARLDHGEKSSSAQMAAAQELASDVRAHGSKLVELCTRTAALEATVREHSDTLRVVSRLDERVVAMQAELHRLYELISLGRTAAITKRLDAAWSQTAAPKGHAR